MQQALAGQLPLVMHFKLLAQYWDVLTRPEHRARLIYTPAQIERILRGVGRGGGRSNRALFVAPQSAGRRG